MIPLILLSVVAVQVTRQQAVDDRFASLEAIAEIQQDRVETLLLERELDYAVFLSSHWLFRAAGLIGECASNPNTERMNAHLASARNEHPIALQNMTLVDHDACVQASTIPETVGDDLSNDPTFADASHGGPHEVVVGAFRHDVSGELVQTVTGPLFIEDTHVATVVFVVNAGWLAAWAADYTGLGATGETVFGLLSDDGDSAVFMTPLRFDPHAAFETTIPMTSLGVPMVQALLGNETTFKNYIDYRGVEVLAVTRRVSPTGWGVVVKMDSSEALATATNLTRAVVAANVLWLLILMGAAAALAHRRTKPIRRITDTAVLVAAGDLDHRVTVTDRDEIGVLANAVNDMTDELVQRHRTLEDKVKARTAELQRTIDSLRISNRDLERMALASAHDLSEPLRKIRVFGGRLEEAAGDALDERSRDYLARMESAADQMQSLIDGLLTYSLVATRAEPFEWVDLGQTARDVVSDLEVRISETGATVEIGEMPEVMGEPTQMRQLLQNLLTNSLKYYAHADGPWVRISAEIVDENDSQHPGAICQLIVEDHGIGIPAEHHESVFDLFTRLHDQVLYPGSGLGLSVCRRILEHHGGTIVVEPNTPKGIRVIASIPITPHPPLNNTMGVT